MDEGYTMGVYLCLGAPIYEMNYENAIVFGKGTHKVKKKAEQIACNIAYKSCVKT